MNHHENRPHRENPCAGDDPPCLVAIGGSAGCFGTLKSLVAGLPADLPVPVLVAVHIGETSRSRLAGLLTRAGPLPAAPAVDGEPLRDGHLYVAPPGRHLMVRGGRVLLGTGPRVNRHRPAVDVLFASVAALGRFRALGVVLSGVLDDGAVGAALIAHEGGRVLVEDPGSAEFSSMPVAALAAAPGARRLDPDDPAGSLLTAIKALTEVEPPPGSPSREAEPAQTKDPEGGPMPVGTESQQTVRMSCPECGGGLSEIALPAITYFRCHVGHQYAPQSLAAAQAERVEATLWAAVAALEEQASLLHYLNSRTTRRHIPDDRIPDDPASIRRLSDRTEILRAQVREWTGTDDLTGP